jgi:hypothetical protein
MVRVVIAGSAEHRRAPDVALYGVVELGRKSNSALLTGDWVPHEGLRKLLVEEKGEAVAAIHQVQALAGALRQGEARGGYAVGRVQRGSEAVKGAVSFEGDEAEERRLPVVRAEAAEEAGVGDEAAPALANGGGPREG